MSINKGGAPLKGILKNSASFEQADSAQRNQDIKWDELNILQTLHPADKDYGFMKIEEPKTPYNYYAEDQDREALTLDPEVLAEKMSLESNMLPKAMQVDEDLSSDEDETEDMKEKRKAFEYKRKAHYNEFYAVQYARKLIETDDDGDTIDNIDEDMDEDMDRDEENEVKTKK